MAEYPGNPGPSVGEDNYSDGGGEPQPAEEKSEEGGETTLIPKSMGMGKDFKVGDEIVLKITGIHGDQYAVEYAPEKGADTNEEQTPPEQAAAPAPAGGGGEMSSMYG
jgi:hypothetical protein